jgi:hypothetical protein
VQRAGGIIGTGRLNAQHADAGPERRGCHRAPREQPAPAHRAENGIDPRHLLEQLHGGGCLAGHDGKIVVGMDEGRAGRCHHLARRTLARRERRGAPGDLSAVALDRGTLGGGRVVRHDHIGAYAAQPRGARQCRRVIAGGVRGDTVLRALLR